MCNNVRNHLTDKVLFWELGVDENGKIPTTHQVVILWLGEIFSQAQSVFLWRIPRLCLSFSPSLYQCGFNRFLSKSLINISFFISFYVRCSSIDECVSLLLLCVCYRKMQHIFIFILFRLILICSPSPLFISHVFSQIKNSNKGEENKN